MPSWTINTPPNWNANPSSTSDYIATPGGWTDATTGEVVVAIRNLAARQGAALLKSVTVKNAKSSYKLGDVIELIADYNQKVVVAGGTPSIAITINGTGTTCTYASGSGTNLLHFTHTVTTSDNGLLVVTSPITLNSATIKDANTAANAPLTFTPPTTSGYIADGVVPTVSTVTRNSAAVTTGQTLSVTVTYSENVTVTGAPSIGMTINTDTTKKLTYASGSGTTALVFSYVVAAGDHAIAGQFSTATTVALNGGSIVDRTGNAPSLTITQPTGNASVTVN